MVVAVVVQRLRLGLVATAVSQAVVAAVHLIQHQGLLVKASLSWSGKSCQNMPEF